MTDLYDLAQVLSSALVLIFAPVITAVICKLGTSFTMIFGTLCISAFYPTMLYPNCFTVYVSFWTQSESRMNFTPIR